METLKEVAIDALLVLFAWACMTVGDVVTSTKGLSCGATEEVQAQP